MAILASLRSPVSCRSHRKHVTDGKHVIYGIDVTIEVYTNTVHLTYPWFSHALRWPTTIPSSCRIHFGRGIRLCDAVDLRRANGGRFMGRNG